MSLSWVRHAAVVLSVLAAIFTLAEAALEAGWWRLA